MSRLFIGCVIKKLIVLGGIVFILVFFVLSIFHAYSFTHPVEGGEIVKFESEYSLSQFARLVFTGVSPVRRQIEKVPSDIGLNYESVRFASLEGLLLSGWFIPAKRPRGTVLIAHGYNVDKASFLNHAKYLHEAGFNVLLFDFRGFGESEGNYTSLGYHERYDVLGAVRYLKGREDVDPDNISGLGFSMGAAALIFAQSESQIFHSLILDGIYPSLYQNVARRFAAFSLPKFPFATSLTFFGGLILGENGFKISPEEELREIHIPILLIHSDKDSTVPFEDSLALYYAANFPKQLYVVKGAKHGEAYKNDHRRYQDVVVTFLNSF